MKKLSLLIIAVFAAFLSFAQQKQELKVLYVGGTSDERDYTPEGIARRTAAFEDFLNRHFTSVTVIDGKDYREEMSASHDVTVFDGPIPQKQKAMARKDMNGYMAYHRAVSLTSSFNYPAVFIADMADRIGREAGAKTDWYCMCLDAHALRMNLDHPIFKGPFKTTITVKDEPVPEHNRSEVDTDVIPMWRVQTRGYKDDKFFRIGMVSRPWGFLDSPETEIISGGVSQKGLDAVALSRHGNFFAWGFAASPAYLTPEAQTVLANAIVYTASLKGERVIARKYYDRTATRVYVKDLLAYTTEEAYQSNEEMQKLFVEETAKKRKEYQARLDKGERLTEMEKYILNSPLPEYKPQSFEKYLQDQMGEDYETFGTNVKAYHKYLDKNTPYFYGAGMSYSLVMDEDARSWKIANNDIRILDKAITMLEKDSNAEETARARRILSRYTLGTFTDAADWRSWFNTYKDKLFFTEGGGWVFLVNDKDRDVPGNDYAAKRIHDAAQSIELEPATDQCPVAVGARHITIEGARQYIVVKMAIRSNYHIYGNVSPQDPFISTTVSLELPDGYVQEEPVRPAARPYGMNGTTQYTDEAVFVIPVWGDNRKQGVKVKVAYQCCNAQVCMPPQEKIITLEVPQGEEY